MKAANPGLDDVAIVEQALFSEDPAVGSVRHAVENPELYPGTPEGHAPEVGPGPHVYALPRYYGTTSTIISTKHVLEARDTLVPFLVRLNKEGLAWYVTGGAIMNAQDQMTAIPKSRREGGLQLTTADLTLNPDIMETMFPIMFGDLDPSVDAFPGFVGHNHFVRHGPLKEDWTKPCPISYTPDEMDELCVSEQEAVWGTELLARLEKFKAKIDPDGIMTCPTGVGFKRAATKKAEEGGAEPAGNVTEPNATDTEGSGGSDTAPAPAPENSDQASGGSSSFVLLCVFVLNVAIAVWF
jgi:hypothetical protein